MSNSSTDWSEWMAEVRKSKPDIDRYSTCIRGDILRWGTQACHCFFKRQMLTTREINRSAIKVSEY